MNQYNDFLLDIETSTTPGREVGCTIYLSLSEKLEDISVCDPYKDVFGRY